MQINLIKDLKEKLPETNWSLVFRSLRQDPLIWDRLQNEEFSILSLNLLSDNPKLWKPINLALLDLGHTSLAEKPVENLIVSNELSSLAIDALQNFTEVNDQNNKLTLKKAGLLSLAIYEKWKNEENWDLFFTDNKQETHSIWQPIFACLFGIIDIPETFLDNLLAKYSNTDYLLLALHGLLTNQYPDEEIIKLISNQLLKMKLNAQLQGLKSIDQSYPNLSIAISNNIIKSLDSEGLLESGEIKTVQELFELAEIFQISGDSSKAIPLLDAAWEQTRRDQINISANYANAAVLQNDIPTAHIVMRRAVEMNPKFEIAQADFAIAQFKSGKLDPKHFSAKQEIDEDNNIEDPANLLIQAKLALDSGDNIHAKNLIIKTFDLSKNNFSATFGKNNQTNQYLSVLVKILFELKLYPECIVAAKSFINKYPNDFEILGILSETLIATGNFQEATEISHLTVSLNPKSNYNRRVLGKALIAQQSWKDSFSEFNALVENSPDFNVDDQYSKALSALKLEEYETAIETSKLIINEDESNGAAIALIGEALINKGEIEKGLNQIDKAISISPEIPEPWLALSNYHHDNDDIKLATEKLITANQVIPENAELRFELGKCYLKNNFTTKALTEIQHAASLLTLDSPVLSQEVYISLGSTLMEMGYFDEAKKRLSLAHSNYPYNVELSHVFAKSLIGVEEIPQAIDILSKAIISPNAGQEIFQDYGEAHLKLGENAEEAIFAFEKVLSYEPDNPKSIALMAEAIALDGDLKKSIETYKEALSKGLGDDPEWNLRIKIGMAKAALSSNKSEVAVAALEDLLVSNPDDLRVLQILTDAYLTSNLPEMALKNLEAIQQFENNYPATLLWIADKALVLDQKEMATNALLTAVKIAPDNSNVLVRLGYMHLHNEEISLAKEIFEKVLSTSNPAIKDLRLIVKALKGLDDILECIPYLERATATEDDKQLELIIELMAVYLQVNKFEEALKLIEQQISLSPTEVRLLQTKADILLELNRPLAALSTIQEAIKIEPKNSDLHMDASKLFRINKDLPSSLLHSDNAIEIDPENFSIQINAAEINLVNLHFGNLDTILKESGSATESNDWRMIKAERLIQKDEYSKATELMEKVGHSNNNPRYLAIQAQLLNQSGEYNEAKSILELAVKKIDTVENINLSNEELNSYRYSIVQAANNLFEWEIALGLSADAIKSLPNEPLPYWLQLKSFCLRAEFQHLCISANALNHAPGPDALNEESINFFEETATLAIKNAFTDSGKNEIKRWQARGELAFGNVEPNLEQLSNSAEDIAAQVSYLRRQGNIEEAIKMADSQNESPSVLLQRALCLSKNSLIEAQSAAFKAAEKQGYFPINYAILANLAEQNDEISLASNSISTALNIWGDEPEWHILAGQLQATLGFRSATIAHFEKANHLRPKNISYILELGKAHLADQRSENAIKLLENAVQHHQDNPEIWSCLATAYQDSKNYEQASFCVDKLTELIPDQVEPYIVGAKINLSAEKLDKAEKMISKALSIDPDLITAHQLQAQVLSHGNNPDEAISVLDKAIAKTADPLPLLIDRAKIIPLVHGEENGLGTLRSIAKEYPQEPTVLKALTEALINAEKYDEAIQSAQYALKVNFGKLEQKEVAQLQYQLGILLHQSGQYDLSIHYLMETIQLSPGFLSAYLEIAEVYNKRRQHTEALDYLKQAISIAPNDARPFTFAGNLLKEVKDYHGAKDMLERAASLAPKDLEIQRKLGAVIALTLVHPTQQKEE